MAADDTKSLGVLIGLAAGDRIGGPAQMAVRVAESLAQRQCFDPDDILARYLDWWRTEGFDTGPTAEDVFEHISSGMDPAEAVRRVDRMAGGMTAGCNPAHRSAALALSAHLSDEKLPEAAAAESRLTHLHPLAGDVAAAVVSLCRALLRGADWQAALHLAARDRLPQTQDALRPCDPGQLNPGGYAPDVLRAATHFVDRSEELAEALERSIAFAGASNYCPVLVGSIGGARWGSADLAPHWYAHHGALIDRISTVAVQLADQWPKGPST
jgi:ADP-ribosylglycohydrolase